MRFLPVPPALGCLAFLICVLPLAACNESEESPDKVVVTKDAEDLPTWLTPKEKIEPSVWLRSREVGHEVLPTDPEVDRLRRALQQAEIRFYEDPRMIANRTDQTRDMLGESHLPERSVDILTGMIDVADTTRFKKLYGEMCQHYLNLRKNGKDRTDALSELGTHYRDGAARREGAVR